MLLIAFNLIIADDSFPTIWKTYDITLIPKPGKKGFRPISLASARLKIFEKLISRRFDRFVELDLILPPIQFGFRRGRSCEDCYLSY